MGEESNHTATPEWSQLTGARFTVTRLHGSQLCGSRFHSYAVHGSTVMRFRVPQLCGSRFHGYAVHGFTADGVLSHFDPTQMLRS